MPAIAHAKLGRVLALYASASFAVLQVVDLFQDRLDLPDWIFPASVILLVIGLPLAVLTAIVQVKDFHPFIERHFTWKRSLSYGALAFLILALSAGAYVGSRALGIGPGASLVSSGVLNDADRILIAQFSGTSADSTLTNMFTEAVRISLANSDKVRVLAPSDISDELTLMKLPRTTPLKGDVAREVAVRLGAKAIVSGTLARVGDGYITTLTLVSPANGETLLTSSTSAGDAEKLIASIDKLSRRVRTKIGDSLSKLRGEPPLARATTASLEALEKYSLAARAASVEGNLDRAARLYEEAIALDSTFVLAYGRLSAVLTNRGDAPARAQQLLQHAHRFRDRLTWREQRLFDAAYAAYVLEDYDRAADAYKAMLEDGDSSIANNLGWALLHLGRHREAEPYLRLAIRDAPRYYQVYSNLAEVELDLGNVAAADSVADLLNRALPGHPRYHRIKSYVAALRGQYDEAREHAQHLADMPLPALHVEGVGRLAFLELLRGRTARARELFALQAKAQADRDQQASALAARLRMAIAIALAGRREEARAEIERALAETPMSGIDVNDRPYGLLQLAWLFVGDADRARATGAQRFAEASPVRSREDSVWLAGFSAWAARDAATVLRVTADTSGLEHPTFMMLLRGRAFELLGQRDSAIAAYEISANRVSGGRASFDAYHLGDTYERLAGLYQQRGDGANARKYLLKLTELWKDADGELKLRAQRAAASLNGEFLANANSRAATY